MIMSPEGAGKESWGFWVKVGRSPSWPLWGGEIWWSKEIQVYGRAPSSHWHEPKRGVDTQKGRAKLARLVKSLSQITRCFKNSLLIEWQEPSPEVGSSPVKIHEQKHIVISFFLVCLSAFFFLRQNIIRGQGWLQIQCTFQNNTGTCNPPVCWDWLQECTATPNYVVLGIGPKTLFTQQKPSTSLWFYWIILDGQLS